MIRNKFRIFLLLLTTVLISIAQAEQPQFLRAERGYQWSFPRDHGAHPGYQTEWWYYTGQLFPPSELPFVGKPRYGFQLTFFRRAGRAGTDAQSVYLAHAVVTDLIERKVLFNSRLADEALGVGLISRDRLNLSMGDWSAEEVGGEHVLKFAVTGESDIESSRLKREIRLRLRAPVTSPIFQGESGFSQKGLCPTCASLYYSIPRMEVVGEVYTESKEKSAVESVKGIAWMDHEIMSNALSEEQTGWDWMGLMLQDGRSVTLFQLRATSGEPFSSVNVCNREKCRQLSRSEFQIEPRPSNNGSWTSRISGAIYPIRWHVSIPKEGIDTVVQARVPASELGLTIDTNNSKKTEAPVYWEGPVASEDESILGYLEMTGYAGKISL